ncbi:MAG: DUF192 domain-containing protein [bacterium]
MPELYKKQNKISPLIILLGIVLLALIGFFGYKIIKGNTPQIIENRNYITINSGNKNSTVYVEIAKTAEEHEIGLMNRKSMKQDEGMLFIFNDVNIRYFWMKDTYIPLDMIFFDDKGNVVNIVHNAEPCVDKGDNCQTYNSVLPAKYVLEVNANWAKLNLPITNGTKLDLTKIN